jgi:hypothetical protein
MSGGPDTAAVEPAHADERRRESRRAGRHERQRRSVRARDARKPSRLALVVAGGSLLMVSNGAGGRPFCGPGCLEARLTRLTGPDGRVDSRRADEGRAILERALAVSPFDASAWLRLAALEAETTGVLGERGRRALDASYRYAPVNAEVARWRLVFTFDHWREVSPATREAARAEMRSLGLTGANRAMMRGLEGAIGDPAGRLAYHLLLTDLV